MGVNFGNFTPVKIGKFLEKSLSPNSHIAVHSQVTKLVTCKLEFQIRTSTPLTTTTTNHHSQ